MRLLYLWHHMSEIKNKVTENSNLKNNDKCTIRFQVRDIVSSCRIKSQVRNIDLNLDSSTAKQKRAKNKLISIKNPK